MSSLGFILILIVIIALFAAVNVYIGRWLWKHLFESLRWLPAKAYGIGFAAIAGAGLFGVGGAHLLPHGMRNAVYTAGGYWMAAVMYLLLLIVAADLVKLVVRRMGLIREWSGNARWAAGAAVIAIVGVLLVYGTLNARNLQVTRYDITIPKQAGAWDQLRVALVTDLHLGSLEDSGMAEVVATLNRLQPDLVLIGGDMIDANRDTGPYDLSRMEHQFRNINSTYGTYAVLGNHDYDAEGDSADRIKRFEEAGVQVLRDSSVKIADSLYLVGRENLSYERISGQPRKALSALVEGVDGQLPVIVMDHQPADLNEPRAAGADLQVSGHTHKGQLYPINFITDWIFELDYGHSYRDGLHAIVSSGARTWGPPVRIGSPCEVVDIRIQFE